MVELIEKSPCAGLLPLEIGQVSLTENVTARLTSLAPFRGQENAFKEALKAAHGMAMPKANRATGKAGKQVVWFGQGRFLLIGPVPDARLAKFAAVVDQSDAWAVVTLKGDGAEGVLARLTPIDLRKSSFKGGHTARTDLMHMMASITRIAPDAFQIMVFRGFSRTLVHDLEIAMQGVAARGLA